jgi:hypothetical protein
MSASRKHFFLKKEAKTFCLFTTKPVTGIELKLKKFFDYFLKETILLYLHSKLILLENGAE